MMECKFQPQLIHSDPYRQLRAPKQFLDPNLSMEPFQNRYADLMNPDFQTRNLSPKCSISNPGNLTSVSSTDNRHSNQPTITRKPKNSNLFRLLTNEQKANVIEKEEPRSPEVVESEPTSKSNAAASPDVKFEHARGKPSAFRNLFAEKLDADGFYRRVPPEAAGVRFQPNEDYRNIPNGGYSASYVEAMSAQVCRMSVAGLSEREISTALLVPESTVREIVKSLNDAEGDYRRPAFDPWTASNSQFGVASGRRMTMPTLHRRRPHVECPLDLRVREPLYPGGPVPERPVLVVDGYELALVQLENQRFVLRNSTELTRLKAAIRADDCRCCSTSGQSAQRYQSRVHPPANHSQHSESHMEHRCVEATGSCKRRDAPCDRLTHAQFPPEVNKTDLCCQPLKKRRRMISPSSDVLSPDTSADKSRDSPLTSS